MSSLTIRFFSLAAIVIFVVSTALVLSDVGQFPWTNNNSTTSSTRSLGSISKISLETPYKVTILQGNTPSITLKGNTNRIDNTLLSEQGDQLVIKDKRTIWGFAWWNFSAEAVVTIPALNSVSIKGGGEVSIGVLPTGSSFELTITGAGTINGSQIKTTRLTASISGAGTIDVAGSAEDCNYSISGAGEIKLKEMSCNSVDAKISGAGTIRARAKNLLSATISGAGEIEYYGNPQVTQSINGVGTIKKRGE